IHVRDGAGQDWLPSDRAMAMAGGPSGKSAGKAKPQALRLDEDGPTLEEAIQALDEGRDDALPAAGLGGGGGGAMTPGLRADRVIETVSPLEFNYDTAVRSEGSPFTPVTAGFESGSGGNPPSDSTPVKVNNPPQVLDPDGLHFDPVVGKYITLEDT